MCKKKQNLKNIQKKIKTKQKIKYIYKMKKVELSSKKPKKKEEKKEKELSRFRIGEHPFIIIKYIKQGEKIPERYFKEEKKKIEPKIFEGIANGITEAEINRK